MGGFGGRGGGGFGGGAGFGGDGGGRFGPTGHDYQFAGQPGTSGVDENKVNSLIAQRLQCKMSRDFDTADRIRDDLRAMGVWVDDKQMIWRSDHGGKHGDRDRGGSDDQHVTVGPSGMGLNQLMRAGCQATGGGGGGGGGGFGGGGFGGGGGGGGRFGPSGHDYQFAGQPGTSGVDENKVNSLIAQRLQCKMSRDFDTADRIRDDLRAMGVEVDDKVRTWACAGGGGFTVRGGGGGGGGGGDGFAAGGGGAGFDNGVSAGISAARGMDGDMPYDPFAVRLRPSVGGDPR
jgi:hypothetical protein